MPYDGGPRGHIVLVVWAGIAQYGPVARPGGSLCPAVDVCGLKEEEKQVLAKMAFVDLRESYSFDTYTIKYLSFLLDIAFFIA